MIKKEFPNYSKVMIKCYSSQSYNEYEVIPVPNIFSYTTIALGYENLRHYFQNADHKIKVDFPHADGISMEEKKELTRIIAERNIFLEKKIAEELKQSEYSRPY